MRPVLGLAPMANVTDCAFRCIFAKYGKPSVIWTEFVSTEGLCDARQVNNLLLDLKYTPEERPIVAQIFGADPAKFRHVRAYYTSDPLLG